MAPKADAHVHLEAMEEAENEDRKPAKAGDTGGAGLPMGEYKAGLLANRQKPSAKSLYNKRKSRTGRVL